MAVPIVLSPETAYASKTNIVFPGTEAQAEAAEVVAKARIEAAWAGSTVTVPDIPIANP